MDILNNLTNSIINFYNFVISSISIDSVIKFSVIYFFILWWAFVIWVIKDITNRTTNILLQVVSLLIVIFLTPIFWLPVYLLLRPRTTIFEKYYEEGWFDDEEAILEEEKEDVFTCPKCGKEVTSEFNFCPYCETKLTLDCPKCNKTLRADWKMCPYCGNHDLDKKTKKEGMKVEVEKVEKVKKTKKDILKDLSPTQETVQETE